MQLIRTLVRWVCLWAAVSGFGCVSEASGPPAKFEPGEAEQLLDHPIAVRAVDVRGQPVAGVTVTSDPPVLALNGAPGAREPLAMTDTTGTATFRAGAVFNSQSLRVRPVFVTDAPRELVALLTVTPENIAAPLIAVLTDGYEMRVQITGEELEAVGRTIEKPWVRVVLAKHVGEDTSHFPAVQKYEHHEFEPVVGATDITFLLPRTKKDKYRITAGAKGAEASERLIHYSLKKRHIDATIGLQPSRADALIGRPAPELRQIKGWKGGGPVELGDLRGKVVMLDFWGYWCGPCIASMPKLIELHDKYSERGLVIIAIHDDSVGSVAEMDSKLARIRAQQWNGRDLPFLVALDGGGKTRIPGMDTSTSGATTAAYGVTAFPTSFLIDRTGNVIKRFHPHHLDAAELETLLKDHP